jgi:hypothetical protein
MVSMAGRGKIIALLGVIVLIGIVVHTGWAIWGQPTPTCELNPQRPPAPDAIVYSPQTEIDVNGYLCLAWKPKALFKAENATRLVRADILKAAQTDEQKVEDHANQIAAAGDAAATSTANAAVKSAQARTEEAQTQFDALPKAASLVLFIDGRPAPITFEGEIQDVDGWAWQGRLLRAPEDANSDDGKAWRALLSSGGGRGLRNVQVALGDKDAKFPRKGTEVNGLKLRILEPFWVIAGAAAFLAMTVGLVMWGWNTGMLRDRSPASADAKPPFSLGRVQMAWWFMLSLAGFLFIWLLTGQWMSVFTMSVVGLVGISGASGAAAMAIDTTPPPPPAPGAVVTPRASPAQSQGFIRDLTTSGDGVVLHRIQMLAWTVVLGFIFAWSVVWNYTFPAFDSALLVLAGLVNGVYVGFKFPEKNLT